MARILCIEDEADIREDITEELRDSGFETVEAANGREGLEVLQRDQPDLVLCDISMPVMDGYQLLTELREHHPDLAEVPFLFLSALSDREHVISGKSLGADDYLTKPIDFDVLLATVKARLQQINRLRSKKNKEMVKLYTQLSGNKAAAKETAAPGPQAASGAQAAPKPAAAAPTETSAAQASDKPADSGADVRQKLGDLAQNTSTMTAGRVQMVGLQSIKQELGDRWHKLADRVLASAEATIKQHLQTADLCTRGKNDDFVVCFATLSEEEAWFKAQVIEKEIRDKLLGDKGIGEFVKSMGQAIQPERLAEVNSEVAAIETSAEEVSGASDLSELISKKLSAATARIKANAQMMMQDIYSSCTLNLRQVHTRDRAVARFKIEDLDPFTRSKQAQLKRLSGADPKVVADLDMLVLGKVAEHAYERAHMETSPILVEVFFSTIFNKGSFAKYVGLCNQVDEIARKQFIFKIRNLPKDGYSGMFAEPLGILRSLGRLLALQLSEPDTGNLDLAALRIPLFVIGYEDFQAFIGGSRGKTKVLIDRIHATGGKVIVDDVPKSDVTVALKQFAFDFFSTQAQREG